MNPEPRDISALIASSFALGGNVTTLIIPVGYTWISWTGIFLAGLSTLYFALKILKAGAWR